MVLVRLFTLTVDVGDVDLVIIIYHRATAHEFPVRAIPTRIDRKKLLVNPEHLVKLQWVLQLRAVVCESLQVDDEDAWQYLDPRPNRGLSLLSALAALPALDVQQVRLEELFEAGVEVDGVLLRMADGLTLILKHHVRVQVIVVKVPRSLRPRRPQSHAAPSLPRALIVLWFIDAALVIISRLRGEVVCEILRVKNKIKKWY